MAAARHKPLPYAAGQLIDGAIMDNTEAARILYTLSQGKLDDQVAILRSITAALYKIRNSTDALKGVKVAAQPENGTDGRE